MGQVYADIRVSGNAADVRAFVQLCATVGWLCGAGASRRVPVEVDGDGSGDLRFTFNGLPLHLPFAPDIEHHELQPIHIGG